MRRIRAGSVVDLPAVLGLLDRAVGWLAAQGLTRQRVDCYAGGDGRLVRYYESAGFTRVAPFDVNGWAGQLLERRA